MSKFVTVLTSQVGRKLLTGLTGIALSIFVIGHLLGNLQLLIGADMFNRYAHSLSSLGPLLWLVEVALVAVFAIHTVIGVSIYQKKKKARSVNYSVYNSAGKASYQTSSSRSMIVTGTVLLIFLVIHVATFKFGLGLPEYTTVVDGVEMKDLYRNVYEVFQNPIYVALYVGVMVLLGMHLRHGAWSSIQSLGALNKTYRSTVYTVGVALAIIIALGFLVLPVWLYIYGITKGAM
ncbi:succinate dehydrogenase cytochrome b subunit [bacterium]|nr:MAG: succinate dehydrogenase cytochrome b subunit [bacterium]